MHGRTPVGLKLLMLFVSVCTLLISPVLALASEIDTLLNSSHVTSWAYYQGPNGVWYISNSPGTTYGLGLNNSRHASWVAIADLASVANLDFVNKNVSLSSSTAAWTSSSSYLADSVVRGEADQTVYGPTAKNWADSINGKQLAMQWYFFHVQSTDTWYIVQINGTDSKILRFELTPALDQYDWQKPLDASGVGVDTANWTKEFFQENGAWKVRFSDNSTGNPSEFLSFPLSTSLYPEGAYTQGTITSVLDHYMSSVYESPNNTPGSSTLGTILSFTGESFKTTSEYPIVALACYPKAGNAEWSPRLRELYKGTGLYNTAPDKCSTGVALNYEGHPGYDYVAALNTPIKAAAHGWVVHNTIVTPGQDNTLCVPKGMNGNNMKGCAAWGAVGIDHGNGYITQYLHMNSITVTAGQEVNEGDPIGLSGNTGLTGNPHLHFEVLRLRSGSSNDFQPGSYATVDPYGFDTSKGYADYMTQFNGYLPNICLWKGGCKFQ